MPEIMALAEKHDLKIIEDCAQAHGAEVGGQRIGSFGHAAAFSFCHDKIMSTGGEGGMILTNDEQIRDIAWSLRDHGRNREQTLSNEHPFGFRWTQDRIGTNGRMTEMQAAIGRCQLKKVDNWLSQRSANANTLADGLKEIDGVHVPTPPEHISHAYYRFTMIFDDGDRRDQVVQHLNSVGVPAAVGPCPEIYREKAFVQLGFVPPAVLPVAADLGKRSMVLPVHPGMESFLPSIIDHIATPYA
jgi:dTDP-4-amino-4,6-dideoxygalactose transaminase